MNKERLDELLAAKTAAYAVAVSAATAATEAFDAYYAFFEADQAAYVVFVDAEYAYNAALKKSKLLPNPNK